MRHITKYKPKPKKVPSTKPPAEIVKPRTIVDALSTHFRRWYPTVDIPKKEDNHASRL